MNQTMKALGYERAHALDAFAVEEWSVPVPSLRPGDVRVAVKAVSVNPVDYKIRQSRDAEGEAPVILGWDAAGVVEAVGADVEGFAPGDEVYYAGDLLRDGSNAEYQAVDHRLVAKKPANLDFAQAAALPLTALTAWEALFERPWWDGSAGTKVLVIGAAGGVGSIAVQLLKAKSSVTVIGTASRSSTQEWARRMGADHVIDHRRDLRAELDRLGLGEMDVVFGTTHSADYVEILPSLIRPFGHFVLIDDPEGLDVTGFKRKAISTHWEFMFAKSMFGHHPETQGRILAEVAALVEAGTIVPTATVVLEGLTRASLEEAHRVLESGKAQGKIVIAV